MFNNVLDTGGKMNIPAQLDEIVLKIYSIDYLLKCRIDGNNGRIVKLAPLSGKVDMFQIDDPTVLLFYLDGHLHMLPADVRSIDKSAGLVELEYPEKEINEERRIFERYPVSLTVSARRKFSGKRLHFVAKNVSMYGMAVISQVELDEEEQIDIDLITDKSMFYFSGRLVWKRKLQNCFEYGLQLTHFDIATKSSFEAYLEKQRQEYEKMLSKAR